MSYSVKSPEDYTTGVNEYAVSLVCPGRHLSVGIPDPEACEGLVKALNANFNLTGVTSAVVVFQPQFLQGAINIYVPATSPFSGRPCLSYLTTIYPSEDLASNYQQLRLISAGLELWSDQLPSGAYSIQGRNSGAMLNAYFDYDNFDPNTIISYTPEPVNNQSLQDGLVALYFPAKAQPYEIPDGLIPVPSTSASAPASGLYNVNYSASTVYNFGLFFNTGAANPAGVSTAALGANGNMIQISSDLQPGFVSIIGRAKITVKVTWTQTTASDATDLQLNLTYTRGIAPVTTVFSQLSFASAGSVLTAGNGKNIALIEYYVTSPVPISRVTVSVPAGATGLYSLKTSYVNIDYFDVLNPVASLGTPVLYLTGMNAAQTTAVNAYWNYECIPDLQLQRQVGNFYNSPGDPRDYMTAHLALRSMPNLRPVMTRSEYSLMIKTTSEIFARRNLRYGLMFSWDDFKKFAKEKILPVARSVLENRAAITGVAASINPAMGATVGQGLEQAHGLAKHLGYMSSRPAVHPRSIDFDFDAPNDGNCSMAEQGIPFDFDCVNEGANCRMAEHRAQPTKAQTRVDYSPVRPKVAKTAQSPATAGTHDETVMAESGTDDEAAIPWPKEVIESCKWLLNNETYTPSNRSDWLAVSRAKYITGQVKFSQVLRDLNDLLEDGEMYFRVFKCTADNELDTQRFAAVWSRCVPKARLASVVDLDIENKGTEFDYDTGVSMASAILVPNEIHDLVAWLFRQPERKALMMDFNYDDPLERKEEPKRVGPDPPQVKHTTFTAFPAEKVYSGDQIITLLSSPGQEAAFAGYEGTVTEMSYKNAVGAFMVADGRRALKPLLTAIRPAEAVIGVPAIDNITGEALTLLIARTRMPVYGNAKEDQAIRAYLPHKTEQPNTRYQAFFDEQLIRAVAGREQRKVFYEAMNFAFNSRTDCVGIEFYSLITPPVYAQRLIPDESSFYFGLLAVIGGVGSGLLMSGAMGKTGEIVEAGLYEKKMTTKFKPERTIYITYGKDFVPDMDTAAIVVPGIVRNALSYSGYASVKSIAGLISVAVGLDLEYQAAAKEEAEVIEFSDAEVEIPKPSQADFDAVDNHSADLSTQTKVQQYNDFARLKKDINSNSTATWDQTDKNLWKGFRDRYRKIVKKQLAPQRARANEEKQRVVAQKMTFGKDIEAKEMIPNPTDRTDNYAPEYADPGVTYQEAMLAILHGDDEDAVFASLLQLLGKAFNAKKDPSSVNMDAIRSLQQRIEEWQRSGRTTINERIYKPIDVIIKAFLHYEKNRNKPPKQGKGKGAKKAAERKERALSTREQLEAMYADLNK